LLLFFCRADAPEAGVSLAAGLGKPPA
jgi:hypothetical protein